MKYVGDKFVMLVVVVPIKRLCRHRVAIVTNIIVFMYIIKSEGKNRNFSKAFFRGRPFLLTNQILRFILQRS